jgi:hypothetical protein
MTYYVFMTGIQSRKKYSTHWGYSTASPETIFLRKELSCVFPIWPKVNIVLIGQHKSTWLVFSPNVNRTSIEICITSIRSFFIALMGGHLSSCVVRYKEEENQ